MRIVAALWMLLGVGFVGADEAKKDAALVREVALKPVGMVMGKVTEPLVITTEEELKKNLPGEEALALVTKNLDLTKEKVLLFGWSGSGRDQLTFTEETKDKKTEVLFTYKAGLTRDLRPHLKAIIMPKDATYKVVTGR
jgi:hypothetical protein